MITVFLIDLKGGENIKENAKVITFISVLFLLFMIIGSASAMEVDGSSDIADDSINVTQSNELKVVDDVSPDSNQLDDASSDAQMADELDEDVSVTSEGAVSNAKASNGLLGASDEDVLRAGNEYYVSLTGRDNRNAGSLNDPFRSIQYALSQATNNDVIYIMGGTYTVANGNNRDVNVQINKPISILAYDNQKVIFDGTNTNNIIWTITANNVLIDGITFQNAHTNLWGGAIYSEYHRNITINKCEFINNRAPMGSAVNLDHCTNCLISNCNFTGNNATTYSAGAVAFYKGSNLNAENCSFISNHALNNNPIEEDNAGALYWRDSSGSAVNCYFEGNSAMNGGAIDAYSDDVSIIDCQFVNNTARNFAGAIYTTGRNIEITGTNFTGNVASYGSAIYNTQYLDITNTIILDNRADSSSLTINNIVVEGNQVTITTTFRGQDNIINGMFHATNFGVGLTGVTFTNVTYWGVNGMMNTGATERSPVANAESSQEGSLVYYDTREAGQNMVVDIYNRDTGVLVGTYSATSISGIYGNNTFIIDDLDHGRYYAIARHVEDEYYADETSNRQNFEITTYKTILNLTVNESSIYIGDSVNITAIVKHGDTNLTVGDVEIYDGETLITTVTAGESFIYTPDTVGTHNLTARYLGSGNYAPSESDIVAVEVNKIDVNVLIYIENVTYPAAPVAIINASAPGTYEVYINGRPYSVTFNEGETSKTVTGITLPVGEGYEANVTFNETDKYNYATNSTTFNVVNGTITATVSVEDVTYPKQAVATVTSDVDGVYTVSVAGKPYTVTVTGGSGSVDIDKLDVGDYTAELSATIANYNPVKESDSFEIIEGVITLHIVVDDVTYPNHPITHVTADVDGEYYIVITPIDTSSSKRSATSIVNVLTANSQIIPVTVSGGSADIDLGLLKAGNYTATVEGDVPNYKVVSDADPFEVEKADPQLNASSSPDDPVYNKDDVTVSHELPGDATGTVTYIVDGGKPVTKGVNEPFTFTPDKAGKHTVTVIYNGDDNYLPSNVTLTVNVAKADSPMDISSDKSKPKAGDKVKMPVSLPEDATGTVTYYVNGKKVAVLPVGETFEFNPEEPGQYNITASYSGDDNYKANTTSIVIEVAKNPNNNGNGTPAKNTVHDVDVLPATGNPIALLVMAILILLGTRRRKEN